MAFPPTEQPTPAPRRLQRSAIAAVALATAMALASCGSADIVEDETTGPTVADGRFGGRFELVATVLDDEDGPVALTGVVFDIDARFGALAVETPCGDLLGSFSLLDDGRAGVSITGGRSTECSDDELDATNALTAALGRIDAWTDPEPDTSDSNPDGSLDDGGAAGFELRSAGGRDRLRLVP